jgi:Ca-activated chloride channel family protein
MQRRFKAAAATAALAAAAYVMMPQSPIFTANAASASGAAAGTLARIGPRGEADALCPLEHTDVKAEISGFIARVTVTQRFKNNNPDTIEAVYTFPLPQKAAVDGMTMLVGDRTIRGKIERREEARRIYEQARSRGQMAGLLDQERPNIFTQAVANIPPGASVKVVITYVETLRHEEGAYAFSFPMVVGPRYIPKHVRDAQRIAPPVTPEGTRAGHDISIQVKLDAGLPIENLTSVTHDVAVERPSNSSALVKLRQQKVLPNKDFVLKYDVATRKVQDAVLAHNAGKGGYFTLMLEPPERVTAEDVAPKE